VYIVENGSHIHRLKGEAAVERPLSSKECVHHVDLDKHNNENSNLVVCPNQSYHLLLHARTKVIDLGGDPNKDKYCGGCKELHPLGMFNKRKDRYDGLHSQCREYVSMYKKMRGGSQRPRTWKDNLSQQFRRIDKAKVCVL